MADAKITPLVIEITITADEARALLDLLALTDEAPTDGVYDILNSIKDDLPIPKGDWRLEENLAYFVKRN